MSLCLFYDRVATKVEWIRSFITIHHLLIIIVMKIAHPQLKYPSSCNYWVVRN